MEKTESKKSSLSKKYKSLFDLECNTEIKEIIKLPDDALIYIDLQDLNSPDQMQLNKGKVRLCEVHLSPSDYLENKDYYDAAKDDNPNLADYRKYQWENRKKWYVFLEMKKWEHVVTSNVVTTGYLYRLQNGLAVLYVREHNCWECYRSITKTTADQLAKLLDSLESNNKLWMERRKK